MYECLGCRLQRDSGNRRLFITDVKKILFMGISGVPKARTPSAVSCQQKAVICRINRRNDNSTYKY